MIVNAWHTLNLSIRHMKISITGRLERLYTLTWLPATLTYINRGSFFSEIEGIIEYNRIQYNRI